MIPSMHLVCQIDQYENMYHLLKSPCFFTERFFSRNVLSIKFRTNRLANKKVFQPKPIVLVPAS